MTPPHRFFVDVPERADAATLSAFAQSVFTQTFAFMDYPPDDLATFLGSAMGMAEYAEQISDPAYSIRVARDVAGRLVGFVKCGPNILPAQPCDAAPAQTRELHQLYVAASAQGSGLADLLMHHVFDDAGHHNAQAVYLSVYVENIRAQRFYARHGFVEVGKVSFHVGNTVDDDRVWRCGL